ncbi:MAG: hypothetical protein BWX47_01637 [candidate division Hyd24-12 bacterium ADurb.Bin004]|nr:MAG: hypothetical protein BWX47_01637 [candidate division Hyd24-12 bacterium ADurb.Bin004]
MSLLDLVQKNHGVGPAPHRLGEMASLVVSDVSRGRADHPGDGVLLHELAHVEPYHRGLRIEEELGQRPGQLGLAHSRRAHEDEAAKRPVRVLDAGSGPPDGFRYRLHRLFLAYNPFAQGFLHAEKPLTLAFEHPGDGNAGPSRYHLGYVLRSDLLGEHGSVLLEPAQPGAKVGGSRIQIPQLSVPYLGHLPEISLTLGNRFRRLHLLGLPGDLPDLLYQFLLGLPPGFQGGPPLTEFRQFGSDLLEPGAGRFVPFPLKALALDLELHDPPPDLVDLDGHAVYLDPQAARGLVDEVYGLVREESTRDIPVGKSRRRYESRILDPDAVVDFIPFSQPPEDADRVGDVGRLHHHGLETPLQGRVLLDVLPVFVEGGGSDAVEFASCEGRLQHVGRIHRALRGSGAYQGVHLVDEENDPSIRGGYLVEDRFQPLLELAPELGPRDQRAHVQCEHPLVAQSLGRVAGGYPSCEAFDHGRLAHARLTEQDRVVLAPPPENLHHPPDLLVPPYDGIELLLQGQPRQVAGVLIESLVVFLRVLRSRSAGSPDLRERPEEVVEREPGRGQESGHLTVAGFIEPHEQVFEGRIIVLEAG